MLFFTLINLCCTSWCASQRSEGDEKVRDTTLEFHTIKPALTEDSHLSDGLMLTMEEIPQFKDLVLLLDGIVQLLEDRKIVKRQIDQALDQLKRDMSDTDMPLSLPTITGHLYASVSHNSTEKLNELLTKLREECMPDALKKTLEKMKKGKALNNIRARFYGVKRGSTLSDIKDCIQQIESGGGTLESIRGHVYGLKPNKTLADIKKTVEDIEHDNFDSLYHDLYALANSIESTSKLKFYEIGDLDAYIMRAQTEEHLHQLIRLLRRMSEGEAVDDLRVRIRGHESAYSAVRMTHQIADASNDDLALIVQDLPNLKRIEWYRSSLTSKIADSIASRSHIQELSLLPLQSFDQTYFRQLFLNIASNREMRLHKLRFRGGNFDSQRADIMFLALSSPALSELDALIFEEGYEPSLSVNILMRMLRGIGEGSLNEFILSYQPSTRSDKKINVSELLQAMAEEGMNPHMRVHVDGQEYKIVRAIAMSRRLSLSILREERQREPSTDSASAVLTSEASHESVPSLGRGQSVVDLLRRMRAGSSMSRLSVSTSNEND